ncbi:1-acyl-sn-glycerol-3-phosphate acyltransferase [Crocinitomix catalasitica]|nr:1-acyl-sn-glycerol-3-phosphate acyltransferase [Crocinitomix catalasitica]
MIESKNPRLRRWLPRFLIRYLQRKIHQKESNQVIADMQGKNGYEFSKYVIDYLNIKVDVRGLENLPREGGAIMAVNHPLGGMDALAIIQEVYPIRTDLKFVVNDLLLQLENLKDLFVGVNKHGSNSKEALQRLNDVYGSNQLVFVFPAGLVSRKKRRKVQDLEWKKTFVTRSRNFGKKVVPVHLDGELSRFFYRLANFRKGIGVKANLEMFYLVDELFKQKGKTLVITFGKPIESTTFDNSMKDVEWAAWVKEKVYNLKKEENRS